jgi:branched-chain amino acid transport system substrate-binding protein
MRVWFWVLTFVGVTSMVGIAHADIVIGVAGPMTGPYAAFGKAMQDGAELAVDDLNARGGINGEILLLQPEDDGCSEKQAEAVAQDLISKNAKMVVGHFCTYPSLAAARIYAKSGVPMITPAASGPALTEAGLNNIYRLVGRDDAQGTLAAARLQNNVAVLHDGARANVALAAQFKTALVVDFKPESKDFSSIINEIIVKNNQYLFGLQRNRCRSNC